MMAFVDNPTIAVLGDAFLDVYHIGKASRLSPEAPIPVVKINNILQFPGGAGNVVENLKTLGATARTVGGNWKLTQKHRLYSDDYQLARWDVRDKIPELHIKHIRDISADAIIISDYGKGSITYSVIEAIAALNLPTFIDTKRSPREFDVVMDPTFFPNQKEYTEHLQDYHLQPKVVRKKGADGIEFQEYGQVIKSYPSWAKNVVSVTGAGDSVIAAYTYSAIRNDLWVPLIYANAAAAVVVAKPYTATASPEEIRQVIHERIQQCP